MSVKAVSKRMAEAKRKLHGEDQKDDDMLSEKFEELSGRVQHRGRRNLSLDAVWVSLPVAQKTFDRIVEHLRTQQCMAFDDYHDACRFRAEVDDRTVSCAVGGLIPDSVYRGWLEASGSVLWSSVDYAKSAPTAGLQVKWHANYKKIEDIIGSENFSVWDASLRVIVCAEPAYRRFELRSVGYVLLELGYSPFVGSVMQLVHDSAYRHFDKITPTTQALMKYWEGGFRYVAAALDLTYTPPEKK